MSIPKIEEYQKQIDRLLKIRPIKQVAIFNFRGDFIAKSTNFEVLEVELEVFDCCFVFNTKTEAKYIHLNYRDYDTKLAESHFIYGECAKQGMMAIRTERLYILIFIRKGKNEFTMSRRALEEAAGALRKLEV